MIDSSTLPVVSRIKGKEWRKQECLVANARNNCLTKVSAVIETYE
jgi:hypothetical protein